MTSFKRGRTALLGLAAVSAFGLLAAPAFAGGAQAPNGLQVAIDPATGQIRQPTAAESQALARQFMAKATGEPQVTRWADGTLSMVLTADYLNVWQVVLNPNGSVGQVCVDGFQAGMPYAASPALEVK
jgi:hypothetical protein